MKKVKFLNTLQIFSENASFFIEFQKPCKIRELKAQPRDTHFYGNLVLTRIRLFLEKCLRALMKSLYHPDIIFR